MFYNEPQRVLDHAALAFVVADKGREHRQSTGVGGGPSGGAQDVGTKAPFRAGPQDAPRLCGCVTAGLTTADLDMALEVMAATGRELLAR